LIYGRSLLLNGAVARKWEPTRSAKLETLAARMRVREHYS
jgi:hypothetical protein